MATADIPDLGRLNEADWTTWVLGVADTYRWTLRYHTHNSRRSEPGFPDWTFINERAPAVVFAELKGWNTVVKDKQVRFVNGLRAAGCAAFIWRPRHADEVWDVLSNPIRLHTERVWLPPLIPEEYAK